nr:MAG TPA: conotoxin [Bacteriophage sp.]
MRHKVYCCVIIRPCKTKQNNITLGRNSATSKMTYFSFSV